MAEANASPAPSFGGKVMRDISQFFVPKDKPMTPPPTPQAGVTQNPPTPVMGPDNKPVLDANGQPVTKQSSNNPGENVPPNPMSAYDKLFQPIVADDKAPKAPTFALTPDVISKAAGGMDFAADLPPELNTRLQSGTLDAATILELVNHVGRSAYSRAMEHSSSLTDKFVGMRSEYDQSQGVPKAVRNILARDSISAHPQAKGNPVVQRHMQFVANEFATQYPDMTPQEVTEATVNYFKTMGGVVTPSTGNKDARGNPTGDLEFDYESYLKNAPAS